MSSSSGFTVEMGRGVNPLPESCLEQIYGENAGIILTGMNELLAVGRAAGMSARVCRRIAGEIQEKTVELERRYSDIKS